MIKYNFSDGNWNKDDFIYAYSPRCGEFPKYTQEENCIANRQCSGKAGFEYVSMITKKAYPCNVRIKATCSFESGAPAIVVSNDIRKDEKYGVNRYGLHHEFVVYEGGCNIWRIVPWPERTERPAYAIRACFVNTPIEKNKKTELIVEIRDNLIAASVNGLSCQHPTPEISEVIHIGMTAAEGINRFYDLTIEEI